MGWLRRMLARLVWPTRAPLGRLSSTRRELDVTRPHHVATIARADRVLRDWQRFDGAFRVVIEHPKR